MVHRYVTRCKAENIWWLSNCRQGQIKRKSDQAVLLHNGWVDKIEYLGRRNILSLYVKFILNWALYRKWPDRKSGILQNVKTETDCQYNYRQFLTIKKVKTVSHCKDKRRLLLSMPKCMFVSVH